MLKDLIKLASDLDNTGLYVEAGKIDNMLRKFSGLYKSKEEGSRWDNNSSEWFKRDIFEMIPEQNIASDYLIKKYNLKVAGTPDEYISFMEVQPWQEEKVRRAIAAHPPSKSFHPEYVGESSEGGVVRSDSSEALESEDIVKLLVTDKDDSVQYKMSQDLFKKIVSGGGLTKGDLTEADFAILG